MGKFYTSQQADKATDNGLECGGYEFKDFLIVHKRVKQSRHQHRHHTNDDHAQGETDHKGHGKRKFCLNGAVHINPS